MTFNQRMLVAGGVLACLVGAPAGARHAGNPSLPRAVAKQSQPSTTVDIVAERFLFTPSEIAVVHGSTLEIRLTSEDTDHGFRVIGTDIDVTIPKRGRGDVVVVFDAKEAGDYTFECSRICGAGHSFMRGTIRVRPEGNASSLGAR